ncbi:uncharacterized protein [Solanum tuberosum]|uniref:uncharacterized protein n=1 Tax=Solanum tuberosum TaxID=4113 RepID=UPI00073A4EFA|nr:PREDICTED: uncharacterized protein LOC107059815 [Solanum tuberosum]
MQLMNEVSNNNRAWYTRDVEIGDLGYIFELSAEQRKREEERDQDMAHMRTQVDLLTKHIVSNSEKVNTAGQPTKYENQDIDLDEEANYLGNQRSFRIYNSGNQGYNSGNAGRNYSREGQYDRPENRKQGNWQNRDGYKNDRSGVYVPPRNRDRASGSSSGSKLEDMLAKVLQKVESTDVGVSEMKGDFSSMSQLVDSHTTSIKQIEQQLGQLSASLNQRKNGSLPNDTIQNPKKDRHCMAIATRSGKIITDPISTVNIPLMEALEQMPGYVKFMKDLVTKKRAVSIDLTNRVHHYSAIATRSLVQKKEDPSAFTILCTIRSIKLTKALCDLGAIINLMPLAIYKKLGFGVPKPTAMRLMMEDRPFLATRRALVDVERGEQKFRLNKEEVKFNSCRSMKKPYDMNVVSVIEVFYEEEMGATIEERLVVEILVAVIMNFEADFWSDYVETVNALQGMGAHTYAPKILDLDLKNRPSPPAKPSIEEPPVLELKQLPSHLRYVFLGANNTLPMILAANLNDEQVQVVIKVLITYKRAIGWTIADITGMPPSICTHKIQLEEDCSPSIKH